MARDKYGDPLEDPPILWEIESEPILAGTKIIAEAWDAAGLYQVGSFIGHRWAEWNGQYRDDVRRFIKGDVGLITKFSNRISGSRDLYHQPGRAPNRSINFITAHDGFTLNDLVSYNQKHNYANLEYNQDGHNANFSWNCGVEGPTDDPGIEDLRQRQIKNFFALLMLSQGTPMFLMGDEVRRSQQGNNNAYCQDNEISWFDWDAVQAQAGLLRYVRKLIRFHQDYQVLNSPNFWTLPGDPEICWHGVKLDAPDWRDQSHSLAFELLSHKRNEHLHVMVNAYWRALEFEIPAPKDGCRWYRVIDTALPSPDDFITPPKVLRINQQKYRVKSRSLVVLTHLPFPYSPDKDPTAPECE
jgi:glycogen operon protein